MMPSPNELGWRRSETARLIDQKGRQGDSVEGGSSPHEQVYDQERRGEEWVGKGTRRGQKKFRSLPLVEKG